MKKVFHKLKNYFFVNDDEEFEEIQNENEELKSKLSAAQKRLAVLEEETDDLTQETQALKKALIKTLPLAGLRQMELSFPCVYNGQTGKWRVVTGICSQNGCEYRFQEFESELEAFRASASMTLRGEKPDTEYACPECYSAYMESVS